MRRINDYINKSHYYCDLCKQQSRKTIYLHRSKEVTTVNFYTYCLSCFHDVLIDYDIFGIGMSQYDFHQLTEDFYKDVRA